MADDSDDALQLLDCDIRDASLALTAARQAHDRNPNAERLAFREMAERTVDELLELRHEMTTVGV